MIKEVNKACEKLNDALGISVELPNLKKKALKRQRYQQRCTEKGKQE